MRDSCEENFLEFIKDIDIFLIALIYMNIHKKMNVVWKKNFWSFVSKEMLISHFFCQAQQFIFCQVYTESLTYPAGERNAVH